MSSASAHEFGDVLRTSRLASGLTQEELAERAGLSVRGLGALERGERSRPQRQTVIQIADALELHGEPRLRFLESALLGSRPSDTETDLFEIRRRAPDAITSARSRAIRRLWPALVLVATLVALAATVGGPALQSRARVSRPSSSAGVEHLPVEGGTEQHTVSFSRPMGVAVDANGNLYVSDQSCPAGQFCLGRSMDRLLEISRTGRSIGSWSDAAVWSGPEGIRITSQGQLVVANANASNIADVASSGRLVHVWSLADWAGIAAPSRVALDQQGNIWVTDTGRQQVIELSARGVVLNRWRPINARGGSAYPSGIAVARDGTIYVSEPIDNRVGRFTTQGRLLGWLGGAGTRPGRFRDPLDLVVDHAGNLYVLDSGNDRVQAFSAGGRLLAVWGRRGAGKGELDHPEAIALDHAGMIYIADTGNRRIQELTPSGRPVAQWGRQISDVRLCASAPVATDPPDSNGMFRGIQLATAQWASRLADIGVKLEPPLLLDDSSSQGYTPQLVQRHARECVTRNDVLAYIAPLDSTDAALAEPILNQGRMATISSANTGDSLTSPRQRGVLEPLTQTRQIPSVTYFRLVPPDSAQGPAAASFVHVSLGASTLFVVDDSSPYDTGLAEATSHYASRVLAMRVLGAGRIRFSDVSAAVRSSKRLAVKILANRPDAVYCACTTKTARPLLVDLAAGGYRGAIICSDELLGPLAGPRDSLLPRRIYATWPGPDPSQASPEFRKAFKNRFGVELQPYDASAYDAAGIALQAIYRVARAGGLARNLQAIRQAVVTAVAQTRYSGATGRIAFNGNGDTVYPAISVYRFDSGQWRYITRARLSVK